MFARRRWKPERLLAAGIPATLVALVEFVRHRYLIDYLSMSMGNWVTAGTAFLACFIVISTVFGVVDRLRNDSEAKRRRLAVFEERDRIASALHDGVCQALFFSNVKLRAAEEAIQRGDADRACAELGEGRFGLQTAQDDIRQAIFNLKLAEAGSDGDGGSGSSRLEDTLQEYVAEHQRQTGAVALLERNCDEPSLTDDQTSQILTIVQEALWNVRKHADAGRVVVRCGHVNGGFQIEVADDGKGFDVKAALAAGRTLGVRIMQERAESVGGRVEIDAAPGRGSRVRVWMPEQSASRGKEDRHARGRKRADAGAGGR